MESTTAVDDVPAASTSSSSSSLGPPTLPPLKSFSSCFLVLEALRSTTERIQRSLVVHYSNLCRGCERTSVSASTLQKREEEEKKLAEEKVKTVVDVDSPVEIKEGDDGLDDGNGGCNVDGVVDGIRSIRRSTETATIVAAAAIGAQNKTEPMSVNADEDIKLLPVPSTLEDDGGLTVEDDFIQPILPPPSTAPSRSSKNDKKKIQEKQSKISSISSSSSSSSMSKGKGLLRKGNDFGDKRKKGEKSSSSSSSSSAAPKAPKTASESLKRKREEEIERIQKKIKRIKANETSKEGGSDGGAAAGVGTGEGIGTTAPDGAASKEVGTKNSTIVVVGESDATATAAVDSCKDGVDVEDEKKKTGENEIEDEAAFPPVPHFIQALMMSEPKLRNFQQISRTLWRELGDEDYRQVVDSFEDEFECEKSKAEKNLLAVSKDKEKDSDGGRGESEPILPCKFSFTCNMGKSCNRRHPNTLAEPDKVLLMRLEDEAGRRLVPRWLRIKDKLMRAFGQSLREKRQKLGQAGFERATRIAEAYYKYEANRKISRRCQFGVKCDIYFCGGSHPHRTSEISGQEFFLYVMDKYSTGYYDEYLFPPFETLFPSFINVERHINYVCCLLRYRRDIGVGLYETVLQEIEEELPKEKLRTNKKVKCKHSFAMCKFKSACKYAHQDAFNDIKVLCDMLKEAKGKANVERLTKST